MDNVNYKMDNSLPINKMNELKELIIQQYQFEKKMETRNYNRSYYLKNKQKLLEYQKVYNSFNKDASKEYLQLYYETKQKQKIIDKKKAFYLPKSTRMRSPKITNYNKGPKIEYLEKSRGRVVVAFD